jgi:hypothetical protein
VQLKSIINKQIYNIIFRITFGVILKKHYIIFYIASLSLSKVFSRCRVVVVSLP